MALTAEEKQEIIAKYATHEGDTGSPEVQVALLSKRIADLTEHLGWCSGVLHIASQRQQRQEG